MTDGIKLLVCKRHCKFYKEGKKEEYACKGVFIIEALLEKSNVLESVSSLKDPLVITFMHDSVLKKSVCGKCDLFRDGCDFRDPNCNYDAPPCGAFIILSCLVENKIIKTEEVHIKI